MKRNSLTLAIGLLLVAIFAMWLCAFQVRTTEVAVVTTFGRPTRNITNANLYIKLPPPIEVVHKFDQRVQNFEDKFTEDFTADGNPLLSSVYIGWKIADPGAFLLRIPGGSIVEAEKRLGDLLRSSKSGIVGKHRLSDFVSVSGGETNFVAIEQEILAAVQSQVRASGYGINVEFLGIKRLGLPEGVTQAVFERMTSERQTLINAAQFEGESRAAQIRSDADRRAAETVVAARGQALQIQAQGEAEAAQYLPVFQKNPDLANFLFTLNALEDSMRDRTTLVLDQRMFDMFGFRGSLTNHPNK